MFDITTEKKEVWRSIPGYEGYYEVSSIGRVRRIVSTRCLSPRILKPSMTARGYVKITLTKDSKPRTIQAHRLVALAFLENPEGKATVNHKNGQRTDNRVENWEWATHKENVQHAWATGLSKGHPWNERQREAHARAHIGAKRSSETKHRISESRKESTLSAAHRARIAATMQGQHAGTKNPSAKLDEEKVACIKGALQEGASRTTLARQYGVSYQTIANIHNGKVWKTVAPLVAESTRQ